jgi:NAD(P)-dependent dehydrogenase (short-subunit alcohol dehydrogenase family)
MNVCLADLPGDKMDRAAEEVAKAVGGTERVRAIPTDVSQLDDVRRLKEEAYAAFGEVALVMNNAAIRVVEGLGRIMMDGGD